MRSPSGQQTLTTARLPRALLLLLIGGSLAAFGGTYPWSTAPVLAGAVLFLIVVGRRALDAGHRPLDAALILVGVAVAAQAVPLPDGVRDALSPHADRVSQTVRLLPESAQRAHPLSIDPAATWQALATLAAAVATFWGARGLLAGGGMRALARGS